MNKKKILIIFLYLTLTNIVNGQTNIDSSKRAIKTYTGPFENGTATYQYYENEKLERIYQGNFSYKQPGVIVTGKFKNNKREGTWKFIIKGNDVKVKSDIYY